MGTITCQMKRNDFDRCITAGEQLTDLQRKSLEGFAKDPMLASISRNQTFSVKELIQYNPLR